MKQQKIDRIITLVGKLRSSDLNNVDVHTIKSYLAGEVDYDYFVKYFDSRLNGVQQK